MSNTPDPLHILYSGDWILTNHLWSTLVDIKYDGSVESIIAKSWTRSLDGKTWTINLKDNLKWSDGSPMTALEIVKSLSISKIGTSHTDLSKSIESIEAITDHTIIFKLKTVVPQFLEGLTYSDWSIVNSQSVTEKDGKFYITKYEKLSGPYYMDPKTKSEPGVVNAVSLIKNKYHPFHGKNIFEKGQIKTYEKCEDLLKGLNEVSSFRMYRDDLTDDCKKKLTENDFEFITSQPSWIIKADFTQSAMKNINLQKRRSIVVAILKMLKNDYAAIGNSRATGLRASYLYGSLPEAEFDEIINHLDSNLPPISPQKIRIVSMEIWSTWKSYSWLIQSLKKLGFEVIENKLSMKDFYAEFGSGKMQTNYELIFIPLGVGDIDPDGSWRIASKYFYSDLITSDELQTAYLEVDKIKRQVLYKGFAKKLIESARYLPLVMNSDIIGVHKNFKIKDGTALRNGTSLYDLE